MEKTMSQEAAFEMDEFLTILNAAVSTLLTLHDYFCSTPGPINEDRANKLDSAIWSLGMYMKAIVDEERKKVDEAFKAHNAEVEKTKRAEHLLKAAAAVKEMRKVKEEKK